MTLVSGIVWLVAGLAMAIIARAVTPREQEPPAGLTLALGMASGFVGGLVITHLATPTLTGFATGIIGSCMGSLVALLIWGMLARRAHGSTGSP